MSMLSQLISQRNRKRKELDTYKNRKRQLEKIHNDLNRDFDNNISESVKNNERSGNSLGAGVQGDVHTINTVRSNIDQLKEKYIWNDANMSDTSYNISNEISRCQTEIDRLENEIRILDRQIEAAREAESEG